MYMLLRKPTALLSTPTTLLDTEHTFTTRATRATATTETPLIHKYIFTSAAVSLSR